MHVWRTDPLYAYPLICYVKDNVDCKKLHARAGSSAHLLWDIFLVNAMDIEEKNDFLYAAVVVCRRRKKIANDACELTNEIREQFQALPADRDELRARMDDLHRQAAAIQCANPRVMQVWKLYFSMLCSLVLEVYVGGGCYRRYSGMCLLHGPCLLATEL